MLTPALARLLLCIMSLPLFSSRLMRADGPRASQARSVRAGKARIPSYGSMALRKAMDAGRSAAVRLLNYAKDGTPLWNQLSVLPLRCGSCADALTPHDDLCRCCCAMEICCPTRAFAG